MDFNIAARADYEDQYVERSFKAYPSFENQMDLNFAANQAFLLKRIKWQPIITAAPTRPPLTVRINDRSSDSGDLQFFPPIKLSLANQIKISAPVGFAPAIRGSEPHIEMRFKIWGTLFTLKPNATISDQEMIGISLLDANNRGLATLEEEAVNGLNDYLIRIGGPDLRSLPFSLAALNALPEVIQTSLWNSVFNPNINVLRLSDSTPKALEIAKDPIKEFISDLCKAETPDKIDLAYFKTLANYMIAQGWKK